MAPIFRVKGSAGAAGIAVLQSLSIVSSVREWLNVAYGRCCGHSGCTGHLPAPGPMRLRPSGTS